MSQESDSKGGLHTGAGLQTELLHACAGMCVPVWDGWPGACRNREQVLTNRGQPSGVSQLSNPMVIFKLKVLKNALAFCVFAFYVVSFF